MLETAPISAAGHHDILGSIPEAQREAFLARCQYREFSKGDVIWHQGDQPGYIAVLATGAVISTYHSLNGKMGVTGIWFPGDLLGGGDIFGSSQRFLTLRCLLDSRLYKMSRADFLTAIAEFPKVGEAAILALSVRLRWMTKLAMSLGTQTAFERVCFVLLSLSETFSTSDPEGLLIELRLTHEEIASFVGVTRPFVTSVLHDLQQRGLIQIRRRMILIRDRDRLEALVAAAA